jgi:hypothetical protein
MNSFSGGSTPREGKRRALGDPECDRAHRDAEKLAGGRGRRRRSSPEWKKKAKTGEGELDLVAGLRARSVGIERGLRR